MAKIDKIKARIDWLKDLFKILVAILVADIAGLSKLYLDDNFNILFDLGVVMAIFLSIIMSVVSKRIEKHIEELEGV